VGNKIVILTLYL